jgi:predicted CopG family antitoxin
VKTITLSDAAHVRLLQWKASPKESFLSVVLDVIPKRAVLADLAR